MRACGNTDLEALGLDREFGTIKSRGRDNSSFVRTDAGDLIDISDIDPADRYAKGPYTCLACGQPMVPALGRTRKHHFKHKAGRPPDCRDETYLHRLAKMVLFSAIDDAIRSGRSFFLFLKRPAMCSYYEEPFGFSCTKQQVPWPIDLAALFDRVQVEGEVEGFVADVLLSSSQTGEKMLLEVAVTHACDDRKLASGLAIVELDIRSEDDARRLRHGIDSSSPHMTCHNLPSPDAAPHHCDAPCAATGLALLLYEDGKAWYSEPQLTEQEVIWNDPRLVVYDIVDARAGAGEQPWPSIREHLRDFMIQQVFEKRRKVKSCLICRNNGGRLSERDIYCAAKERRVWMSSSATTCTDYDPAIDAQETRRIFDQKVR